VRQDVLCVLKTLHHFEVGGLHRRVERVGASFAAFVHVGHHLGFRAQHNLSVILEVNLHDFVGEAEHNSVPRAHPFLDVNNILDASRSTLDLVRHQSVRVGLLCALQVTAEVL